MTDYVHLYVGRSGRCIGAMKLGTRPIVPEIESTDSTCLQFQLMANGMRLTHWDATERAGLISADGGETYIARIKPVGLARDMRGGMAQMIDSIRSAGAEVEVMTGRLQAA